MKSLSCFLVLVFLGGMADYRPALAREHSTSAPSTPTAQAAPSGTTLFQIGRPDGYVSEFKKWIDWEKHRETRGPVHRFVVGKSRTAEWTPSHWSTRDLKNAGIAFTVEIEFSASKTHDVPLYFIIGAAFAHPTEPSLICVRVNETDIEPKRQPNGPGGVTFDAARQKGYFEPTVIAIPPGTVRQGTNVLSITLRDGSWIFYDYLRLSDSPAIPECLPPVDLVGAFRADSMKNVREIVFVVRKPGTDPHWYANFGYYAADADTFPFPLGTGGRLEALDLDTGKVRTIFKDDAGSIRDPQLHYDGNRIVFSYLPAGKRHFNLYEINLDGSGLRRITSGDWDDIEPSYTADGDIVFCSSRSKRWVQCWLTPVATVHRCGPNGENIRELSCNIEHDNTPWPLPDGRILYTRWEYVDRSQVHYHHLWTMNPDGTRQSVFYGNLRPGIVMIDAKPIPGSGKIVASFSPGHGIREHYGRVTVVDPRFGPDNPDNAVSLTTHYEHADPWAFSEKHFMAARHGRLELIDADGYEQTLYALPEELKNAGYWIHEPRPVLRREPEHRLADQTDPSETSGRLALVDIYTGRKMEGVAPGSIKELLVLETLPEPIHYSGGMDQISIGGTFTLERIIGTVPVEPDGSAFMELPALRSFFFVAMDHGGNPVKRMHSFTSVMPGETTSCIGCHEERSATPAPRQTARLMRILARTPHKPAPVEGIPDVFDFPRDIQPILDRHCLSCHNDNQRDGGVTLVGDWGPLYTHSYVALSWRNMFGDNRNRARSNFGPYEIGSCASKLVKLIDEEHGGAKLSDHEKKTIRFWIDAGANYAGTYAANGTGLIGWPYRDNLVRTDADWEEVREMDAALHRRCAGCHSDEKKTRLPHAFTHEGTRYSRHLVFNFTHPERSRILLGPLKTEAGGLGCCRDFAFENTDDQDYKAILAAIERGRRYITRESNRFTMSPFVADKTYIREMIRYGVLPADYDPRTPIDPYATDRRYWESLWYRPAFP
ncbi:MAG TPA: hypothetical protein DEB39_01095 [Planctomycetaceae bacterium]|nr:hypothetical protein [Planctomycetaceae bacterium]